MWASFFAIGSIPISIQGVSDTSATIVQIHQKCGFSRLREIPRGTIQCYIAVPAVWVDTIS